MMAAMTAGGDARSPTVDYGEFKLMGLRSGGCHTSMSVPEWGI